MTCPANVVYLDTTGMSHRAIRWNQAAGRGAWWVVPLDPPRRYVKIRNVQGTWKVIDDGS